MSHAPYMQASLDYQFLSKARVAQKAKPANVLPFTNICTGITNYKNNDRITIQQTTRSYKNKTKATNIINQLKRKRRSAIQKGASINKWSYNFTQAGGIMCIAFYQLVICSYNVICSSLFISYALAPDE